MAFTAEQLDHVEKRLPFSKYQYVTVVFPVANTDVVVGHTLAPRAPTDVKFIVTDQSVGGVVYRGGKAPLDTYTVLKATVAGTYRIFLFIEAWLK